MIKLFRKIGVVYGLIIGFAIGAAFAVTANYDHTYRIVNSTGTVLDGGTASATSANYDGTVRIVNSSGLVLDTLGAGSGSTTVKVGSGVGNYSVTATATGTDLDATNLKVTGLTVATGSKAIVWLSASVAAASGHTFQIGISVDGAAVTNSCVQAGTIAAATGCSSMAVKTGDGSTHTFAVQAWTNGASTATVVNDAANDAPIMIVYVVPST